MTDAGEHRSNGSGHGPNGSGMVDWGLAVATARRLVRPGPAVSAAEARQVVADLREYATLSEEHVRNYTGLTAVRADAPVLIVDRSGWVQANAEAFADVLAPLTDKIRERRGRPSPLATAVGSRVTGLEAGALLAFLSGKVLGQFDPFADNGTGTDGRLLLVAPNVVHVERELGVVPRDFRLWVCLHEETHRVQFTAVPWLRDYFRGRIRAFLEETDLDPARLAAQFRQGAEQFGRMIRGEDETSVLDLVQTPAQKEILDQLTGLMSLLEGHADVVMDGVGPSVIPTVATIREKFQQLRGSGSVSDQLLRRVLGLDTKLRQYRDGAAFVRHVTDAVGMDGFNKVWERPENLPGKSEITDPAAWLRRVHATPELPEQRS
ncbi:MAG TPA: zinc-dependent metalloprotease [Actinopolymorphaceae bacterium]